MMKKLIVLILVLATASLASAGLSLSIDDHTAEIHGFDNGPEGTITFVATTGTTTSAGATMLFAGNLSGISNYSSNSSYIGFCLL